MAKSIINLVPGVSTVDSPLMLEGRFANSNLIRLFQGRVQKRGGWTALTQAPIAGTSRGLHAWNDLEGNAYIASGSEQLLQLLTAGSFANISPVAQTSNVLNAFTTEEGSSTVSILDPTYSPSVGDWVTVATAVFVGGVVLQGDYPVTAVLGQGRYEINIAPLVATQSVISQGITFNFSSVAGDSNIAVALGQAVFTEDQQITVYVSTDVGGTTIQGPFAVNLPGGGGVTDPFSSEFSSDFGGGVSGPSLAFITAPLPASVNANTSENGGAAQLLYALPSLLDNASPFLFGAGHFGLGTFGEGEGSTPGTFSLREWSLDNFGQLLIATPRGGALYEWTPPLTFNSRAQVVSVAPQFSQGIFVAMPQEQIISFGSDGGGFQDPMLVRFSDIANFTAAGSWTATAINQAGSFRLTRGSRIVGGMQASLHGLLWTDVGLWSMNYLGPPFIYGFDEIGKSCGLIAMRAAAEIAGKVVWPSYHGFFIYDGSAVSPLPCAVWNQLYDLIDNEFINTLHAFPNSDFSEVAWHFPTQGSNGVPTHYINLNVGMLNAGYPPDQCWDFGVLQRTAGLDRTAVAPPVGADGPNGLLQAHETAADANGQVMPSFAETGWFKLNASSDAIYLDRIIMDAIPAAGAAPSSATVLVTIFLVEGESPTAGPIRTYGPYTVTPATEHLLIEGRGMFIKARFDFSTLGSFARLGTPIQQSAPAGRG